jgi:hypothetical protein
MMKKKKKKENDYCYIADPEINENMIKLILRDPIPSDYCHCGISRPSISGRCIICGRMLI